MLNRQRCDPLTVTDGYSRLLLACQACSEPTLAQTRPVLDDLFRTYGLPQIIRSDNGVPFSSTALAGLSTLNIWWMKLGIRPERITQAVHNKMGNMNASIVHSNSKCRWPRISPLNSRRLTNFGIPIIQCARTNRSVKLPHASTIRPHLVRILRRYQRFATLRR